MARNLRKVNGLSNKRIEIQDKNKNRASAKTTSRKDSSSEFKLHMDEVALNISLRRTVAYTLLGIVVLNTIATATTILLVGLGLLKLSDTILISLIANTVAQVAAMFMTIIKYLFPTK